MNKIVTITMVVLMSYVCGILTMKICGDAQLIRQKEKEIEDAKERCLEGYWDVVDTNRIGFVKYEYKPSHEERITLLEFDVKHLMQMEKLRK